MLYNALKLIHILSIVAWIGGMAFAHFFLRPAVQALPQAERLTLMRDVLHRFLRAMVLAVAAVLFSGIALISLAHSSTGKAFVMPADWTFMAVLGLVMVLIFGFILARLFPRLHLAVEQAQWPEAAMALQPIRHWVAINLMLGVLIIAVTLLW